MSTTAERKGKTNKHFISGRHVKANSELGYTLVISHFTEKDLPSPKFTNSTTRMDTSHSKTMNMILQEHTRTLHMHHETSITAANAVDSSLSSSAAQWLKQEAFIKRQCSFSCIRHPFSLSRPAHSFVH